MVRLLINGTQLLAANARALSRMTMVQQTGEMTARAMVEYRAYGGYYLMHQEYIHPLVYAVDDATPIIQDN